MEIAIVSVAAVAMVPWWFPSYLFFWERAWSMLMTGLTGGLVLWLAMRGSSPEYAYEPLETFQAHWAFQVGSVWFNSGVLDRCAAAMERAAPDRVNGRWLRWLPAIRRSGLSQ